MFPVVVPVYLAAAAFAAGLSAGKRIGCREQFEHLQGLTRH